MSQNWKLAAAAAAVLEKAEGEPFVPSPRQVAFRALVEACHDGGVYDRITWLRITRGGAPYTWPKEHPVPPPKWALPEVTGHELATWLRDDRFNPWLYENIAPAVTWDATQKGMVTAVFFDRLARALQNGEPWAFPIWARVMETQAKIDAAGGIKPEGQDAIDAFLSAARAGEDSWKVEA
jgi:hypothetical protein